MILSFINKAKYWIIPLLLILTEGFFYFKMPFRKVENAGHSIRNYYNTMAWPEYTNGKKKRDGKLAVIIGNSQSYGNEIDSAEHTFIGIVCDSLSRTNPNLKIENWSLSGIRTTDIELLSIKAQIRNADYIFFTLHFDSWDYPENVSLDYPLSDVNLMIGTPGFWPYLKKSMVRKSFDRDRILKHWIILHSQTVRYRTVLYQKLAQYVPNEDHIFYFGKPINQRRGWRIEEVPDFRDQIKKTKKSGDRIISSKEINRRMSTFMEVYEKLLMRLENKNTKLIFIWAPVSPEHVSTKNIAKMIEMEEKMSRIIKKSGHKSYILTSALDAEYFLSRGHLNKKGHYFFSNKLLPILKHELQ
jgi:hypothetical protein